MRRLSLLLLFQLVPSGWAYADVLNGGFEAGLSGWTALELGQGATVAPSSEAHTGSGSALILTHGAQLPGYAAVSQIATVTPGARYCLSLSVRQAGASGGFGVSVRQGRAAPVADLLLSGAPGEWVSQRACFLAKAKSATVTVYASPGLNSGGGHLDSVSLSESNY